jgi:plastocyanin
MLRSLLFLALVTSAGCTPGSFSATNAGGEATGPVATIDVDLTNDPTGATPAGRGGGYKPLVLTIPVGTSVRFTNSDGFHHTATSIAGSAFPAAYPFNGNALDRSGATLSGGFSSGSLDPGAFSQPLLADKAGTYLFGCFYHYGTPMRATIVVQ